jgi:hypothetical protein
VSGTSLTLYPSPEESAQSTSGPGPEAESNTYHGFRSVDDVVMERIQMEMVGLPEGETESASWLCVHYCAARADMVWASCRTDRACSFVNAGAMP